MTNQSTIDKLIEMHMTPMADSFRIQMQDLSMKDLAFEDRFGMIVDAEYTARKNNALKRLIQKAELEQPDASIAAVDYGHTCLHRTYLQFSSHGRMRIPFLHRCAGRYNSSCGCDSKWELHFQLPECV